MTYFWRSYFKVLFSLARRQMKQNYMIIIKNAIKKQSLRKYFDSHIRAKAYIGQCQSR